MNMDLQFASPEGDRSRMLSGCFNTNTNGWSWPQWSHKKNTSCRSVFPFWDFRTRSVSTNRWNLIELINRYVEAAIERFCLPALFSLEQLQGALTRTLFCIIELQGPLKDARYGSEHSGLQLPMCNTVRDKRVSPAHRLLRMLPPRLLVHCVWDFVTCPPPSAHASPSSCCSLCLGL
jgi:hypothetical protein